MLAVTVDDHLSGAGAAALPPVPADQPLAVLVNPTAGRGRHRGLLPDVLERLAAAGRPLRLLDARTPAQALAQCHEAVADGIAGLVAVGGDGTVHLALQAVAESGVPFGPVPVGTGNDFAADTGFPADPLAAADAIAAAARAGRTSPVDLARMTATDGTVRWFGALLAAGFDALVNERANRMRWPRGPVRYDLAIMVELFRLRPRRYRLVLDGVEQHVEAVLVAVGNCASYGGGMRMCPAADPTDGLLDVVVVGPVSRTTLVRVKPRLYTGTHVTHPMVRSHRAGTVELDAEGITGYADGERSSALPVSITAVPAAAQLLR